MGLMEVLRTDVLSTQSTSEPDVVNGIKESIVKIMKEPKWAYRTVDGDSRVFGLWWVQRKGKSALDERTCKI